MDIAQEHQSALPQFDTEAETEVEPDLNTTTFFPDAKLLTEDMSFSQRIERVNALLVRNNLNRPVLYRILAEVAEEPLLVSELEARVFTMPGFETATQPPFTLIEWLIEVEALSAVEVDEEGNPITEADRADKTEDEIDDMVIDQLITISEYGQGTLEAFDPTNRVADLLGEKPDRAATYLDVLSFLKQKRTYGDIDGFLRGNPILMDGIAPGGQPMQPSVYVDKLASAGAIVYDQGWIITSEGMHILEQTR